MANTLIVDDQSAAGLEYFQSSFKPAVYNSRLNGTYFKTFYPVSGVKSVDNIRFSIPAKKGGKVLQVNKAVVCLSVRLTNKDKSDKPKDDTKAAPCNNFTSAIFCSLNIWLNDTTVCHISNYGAYSQLCLTLNTDVNDETTGMKNLQYEKDTSVNWDDTTTNDGWVSRRNHFGTTVGGKFVFQKDPEFYMFQLQSYLPAFHFLPHCDTGM